MTDHIEKIKELRLDIEYMMSIQTVEAAEPKFDEIEETVAALAADLAAMKEAYLTLERRSIPGWIAGNYSAEEFDKLQEMARRAMREELNIAHLFPDDAS